MQVQVGDEVLVYMGFLLGLVAVVVSEIDEDGFVGQDSDGEEYGFCLEDIDQVLAK